MRPIKFRAWHVENKTMVNFDMEKVIKDQYQQAHLCALIAGAHPDGHLMQFTGLTDINGNDIYTGDILHHLDPVSFDPLLVEFNEDKAHYQIRMEQLTKSTINQLELAIIGNIYQSPELLESV